MQTPRYSQCVLSLLLLGATSAYAQTQPAPDAGALLQQMEKGRALPAPHRDASVLPAAPQPMKALGGPTVTVSSFRFAGNTLLTEAQLNASVASFLNHPIDFNELQNAAAALAETYRKAGWIVRVFLPEQEIANGMVTLHVVEAVFGQVRLEGEAASRVPFERLQAFVAKAQPSGAMLKADALDRALLLIDDLPGVNAEGSLAAGAQASETDLVLKLGSEPLFSGEVGTDNTGARSTGKLRATGDLYANSALGLGDQIAANLIHTKGSDYGRLGFTLPVGSSGLRMGANASYLRYHLVTEETAVLDAKGTSSTTGLEASYPLIRSGQKNLNLSLNYDQHRFDNQASGVTSTHYGVNTLAATLSGNLQDRLFGGGSTSASLTLASGKVNLDGSPNAAADALTTRSAGNFSKLRYALYRQQMLTETLSASASVSGQIASKNLDSSEKFYLGGAYGVRAYPSSEGGGSEGTLVNLELRARLPHNITTTGFFDWGHVTVNRDNDYTGAAMFNGFSLKGGGLSASWITSNGWNLKATLARRIGKNPNPTLTGADQDGSHQKNRLWLQAKLAF